MTAVEWQFNELQKVEKAYAKKVIDVTEFIQMKNEILEHAKKMEKQEKVEFALTVYNKKFSTDKSFVELVAEMSNLSPWIKVCVEVDRSGIVEENLVRHYEFNVEPTREEILALLNAEDIGYDDEYCSFTFYKV